MSQVVRVADSKGRVSLPGFAHATVIIDTVSANEYRIRKAQVIAEDELRFSETDMPVSLSESDARQFVENLRRPPKPNAAARKAAKRFKARHG
jgi:uncharacterized protein (DUF1778 family)